MVQMPQTLDDVQRQYRWLREMRETHPVWLDKDSGCWHVFRYADVYRVTTDYQVFSSERKRFNIGSTAERPTLLSMDPPEHRLYRSLVTPSFTPRALARFSGRIAAIAQELLDQVRDVGHMDMVADFSYPLPATVIAEMLGVPATDRTLFKSWADRLFSLQIKDEELLNAREQNRHERQQVNQEMQQYFQQVLAERRRQSQDDMVSELIAAEVEGEHLCAEDVVNFSILLLLAGHITTTNLLCQAIRCFDEHPEAMEQLRADPTLMPDAVEEVLRYASPVWRLIRVARTDVVIDGVTIPEGAPIFAWLSSANRDEEQFAEPERFLITRSPNKHMAFGHGIHFCVGAPLSRLESAIALPMLLEQLPQLRVSYEEPVALAGGIGLFGIRRLPVTFAPAQPV